MHDNKIWAKPNQTNTKKKIAGITLLTLGRFEIKAKALRGMEKLVKLLNDRVKCTETLIIYNVHIYSIE